MGRLIKVDFSKEGKLLREMTIKLRQEKSEPLTKNQKIDFCLCKQAGVRH